MNARARLLRWPRTIGASLALAALCAPASAGEGGDAPAQRTEPWPARIVELAESLPVQDGGRIKPLSTFASFTLLRLNGKRSATTAPGEHSETSSTGEKITATEWLLDVLFYPEAAARQAIFLVPDVEAIDAIGIAHDGKKKRDRYCLEELRPGLPRLFALAHDYGAIEEKDRSSVQQQIVLLAANVHAFGQLGGGESLAILPPEDLAAVEWLSPAEVLGRLGRKEPVARGHVEILRSLEALARQRDDRIAFERELGAVHDRVVGLARTRGEYEKIGLERAYYRAGLLSWSLGAFVLAFLTAAIVWLRPRSRVLYATTVGLVLVATLLLCTVIAWRCTIRGRPPVSTLYETVLFITAVGALIALALEAINRQRIAVSAAAIVGTIGLFIANGYETLDKQDTMPSLVAVLDTNFWLATHVTAITIGYSAGLLAALLGSLYLIAKLLRWKRDQPAFYRSLARMVYGVVCFGLIFATVGTILGGIWANESWGRFWGWDPKENGALLIVLSQIAILHGRMSGYLREHGVCTAAAFGGTIVAFSWWGVNLLGVGLHSYGFTSGIHSALWTYYGIQWGICALGGIAWLAERRARVRTNAVIATAQIPLDERSQAA